MSAKEYCPNRGDLVWLSFDPQAGHEQAGRRPAFVVSPRSYNEAAGLMLACPVTSKQKGYPFEVPVPLGAAVKGVILADQVRSLDWRARHAELIALADADTIEQVLGRVLALVE